MSEPSPIQVAIKAILEKYFRIVEFETSTESFEPRCVVEIPAAVPGPATALEQANEELRSRGFGLQLSPVGKAWIERHSAATGKGVVHGQRLFHAIIVPRMDVKAEALRKKKRELVASGVLFSITMITVYLSALFYFTLVDPVFGYANNTAVLNTINTVLFMAGMVIIIFCHEMGHKIASDRHEIPASVPFLIPGPPPIGMFGAFVKIKGDMSTRNETFDIAAGGIVLGIIASLVLVIIGQFLSLQVPTAEYINLRLAMMQAVNPGATQQDVLVFIRDNVNNYNILVYAMQRMMYPVPTWSLYAPGDVLLPDTLVIMHPLAFSGWVGLYVSALNLLPVSFFDGGLIFRSVFPYKWSTLVGLGIGFAVSFFISEYFYVFVMLGLGSAMKRATRSEAEPGDIAFELAVPLARSRKIMAVLLLVAMIVLFPIDGGRRLFGIGM
nr:site-2 protease family protein [Candidatus Sigynarchaeota archaeon]